MIYPRQFPNSSVSWTLPRGHFAWYLLKQISQGQANIISIAAYAYFSSERKNICFLLLSLYKSHMITCWLDGVFAVCHFMLVFNGLGNMTQQTFVKPSIGRVGQGRVRGWFGLLWLLQTCDSSKTSWHRKGHMAFQNSELTAAVLWKWSHMVSAGFSTFQCL